MTTDELYYKCLEKIDGDIAVAEFFLISCIKEVKKRLFDVEIDRNLIKTNFDNFNVYMYEKEMVFISNLCDESLSSLIASSLDLSFIYETTKIIWDKIEYATMDEVTATVHTTKAVKSAKMLNKIAEKMKRVRRPEEDGLF